jgi:hypothetical protein
VAGGGTGHPKRIQSSAALIYIARVSVRRAAFIAALSALSAFTPRAEARNEPPAGWFDLDVPGGEATLSALGFSLEERAFTLPVLARAWHDRDQRGATVDARTSKVLAELRSRAGSPSALTIPAPLDAAAWRDILPPPTPPASADLFLRIISDRSALLTAAGLVATSESFRTFVSRDREVLRFIYEEAPAAFALVARRLAVRDGRIVVPGGANRDGIWEALAGASPTRPAAFVRALLTKDQGRLAWYFDTMAALDGATLAAAWPETIQVKERANALYSAFRDPDAQWRVSDQPFRRGTLDAWMVITQNTVAGGVVPSPLPQSTWAALFSNGRVSDEQIARTLRDANTGVSLPWLVHETLSSDVRERRARYEMFRLAQRVFASASPSTLPDVARAVSGLRQSRALLFTLERMQVRSAATWAAAVMAARHVTTDADDQHASVASFQATLALIERMRHSRTIDAATATRLLRSLSDAVRVDKRVPRTIARWVVSTLMPALPPLMTADAWTGDTAYESKILQALAGPAERETTTLAWEGLTYTVDPVAAELDRLRSMRALLPSPGLDAALASERPGDLADALMALVYATALGDPEGPASLSPDVASRHEFGLTSTTLIREELPWATPEERQGNGPWRVQGSLLGLDLGLSRLFLRRIADQQMPQAPTLTLNDLATLTRTAASLVHSELRDGDRDELAASLARGGHRIAAARTTAEFLALAEECEMSSTARELLPWIASRQPEVLPDVFVLRDRLWLGKPALSTEALDRWGVMAEALDGRRVLQMPRPAPWEDYAGRSEVGQVTTQVADLTLRLVEETARLKVPAQLVPALLAFALEDYWHDVRARFADDWPRLTRQAAALSSARIGDYVAALAGGGPLRAQ